MQSAVELAGALGRREITAAALTRQCMDRIARHAELNAVCEINQDALSEAEAIDAAGAPGLLHGLPILIKDNIDVKGLHTTAGSLALADNVAATDAPVIANLRRNGAVILGKANMTELANYTTKDMPNGYSSRGGKVVSAYGAKVEPSGSSTGSAVAVSAGLCPAAIGTDTSFSITGCATVNGVTGYKPPHGVLSAEGIVPIARLLDSAGPITASLADALLVYSAMRDTPFDMPAPAQPSALRLAVNMWGYEEVSEAQRARYDAMLASFQRDGGQVEHVEHPYAPAQSDLMRMMFRDDLEAYLAGTGAACRTLAEIVAFYEADTARMPYGITYLRAALEDGGAGKTEALRERERVRARLLEELSAYDACLMAGVTNVMHFAGLPSLALRMGMGADGLPRGMILYGADEARLVRAALALERYHG